MSNKLTKEQSKRFDEWWEIWWMWDSRKGISKRTKKRLKQHLAKELDIQDGKSYGQGYKEGYDDSEYETKKEIIEMLESKGVETPSGKLTPQQIEFTVKAIKAIK